MLIILAAVSINAVLKTDFIGLATNGTINYAEAQVNEQKQTEELDIYLKDALLKIAQNNKSGSGGTPTQPPITSPTPDSVVIDEDNDLGKYVNYVPKEGTYDKSIMDESLGMPEYSGGTSNDTFKTDTSLKWRIFKVDANTLYLISDKPTTSNTGGNSNTGKLFLISYNGYNNGVKLLNDLCSACYSNSDYSGLVARSINVEDIESVTTYDYTTYSNVDEFETIKYGDSKLCTGIGAPNIYSEYESVDQLGRKSKQDSWYKGYTYGTNVTISLSYWTKQYTSEDANTEWKNPKYYELLISPTNDTSYYPLYWLSSRYADVRSSGSAFLGLMSVSSGKVISPKNGITDFLWQPYYPNGSGLCAIRPLISIPLSSCTITNSTSPDTFDISPK